MRNFYYLHEIDSIAISQFLITKRKSLFVDFMRLKEQNYEIAKNYDCKIVSIGHNCLPQTISVRTGLKLPGWLRKEKQMFFDVAQTNIKSANKIFVIDYWGRGGDFKDVNYYKCRLPFSSFVWHKKQHYFRPEYFEFYRSISQQVLSFITAEFSQKEDNLDPFSYTENCVAYKDFLISMLKENFKVIYDDRLNVIEDLIKLKKLNI